MKLPLRKGDEHNEILVQVIVPSTIIDKPIPNQAFSIRVNQARKEMSNLFGGYTSINDVGGWISKSKKLITEKGVIVQTYAKKGDFERYKKEFFAKVRSWGRQWEQESMAVAVETDAYFLKTK